MEYPEEGTVSGQSVTPVRLAESEVAQRVNNKLRELLGAEFLYLKHIGAGISGNVYLCQYSGDDTRIKNLCDSNNRLSVKILMNEQELEREAEVMQQLYDKSSAEKMPTKHIIGLPISKDDKVIALVMPYIAYHDVHKDLQEDSLKSYLRKFYQSVVNGSISNKSLSDKSHSAVYDDYEIIYAQLINDMHSIMLEFHQLGYLHLDIASRNYILNKPIMDAEGKFIKFTLTLCDYGHTGKMIHGAVNTYRQRTNKPITARDYQDIVNHIATPNTDIFAFKCAVIGMVSMTIDNFEQDYNVLNIGQKNMKDFIEMRTKKESPYKENTAVLASYLNKLKEHVQICPDTHIKKYAKELIECYKEFLVRMPADNQEISKVHELDRDCLLAANVSLFISVIQNRMSDIENDNNIDELKRFMLSVKRLMQVSVTKEFQNSELYIHVKELDSIDKAKKFIKAQRCKLDHPSQKENIEPVLSGGSDKFKWIDMLENAILNWKSQHNRTENKWFGNEFEKNVNDIINGIMKGKITSLEIAKENLDKIKENFAHKIALKKTSSTVEFKKNTTKHEVLKENHHISDDHNKLSRQ